MIDFRRVQTDLLALGLLAVTVFLALALLSYDPGDPPSHAVYPVHEVPANLCGAMGAQIAHTVRNLFGFGAFVLLFLMMAIDLDLFARHEPIGWQLRAAGTLLAVMGACLAIQAVCPHLNGAPIVGSGGYLGVQVQLLLRQHLTLPGTLLLAAALGASGFLLATDARTYAFLARGAVAPWRTAAKASASWRQFRAAAGSSLRQGMVRRTAEPETAAEESSPQAALATDSQTLSVAVEAKEVAADEPAAPEAKPKVQPVKVHRPDEDPVDQDQVDEDQIGQETDEVPAKVGKAASAFRVNPPATGPSDRQRMKDELERLAERGKQGDYSLPELDLLSDPEEFPYELLAKKAQVAAATLERTFQEFGLNIKVVEIDTGPVITQFELELEAGLRLSKVTALADDLAIALRVPAVRVVAPIPGKNTVGIEVPNEKQVMVRLRELIESRPEESDRKRIPLFLGKDVSGRPLVVDMTKMPHLLIAGRTGTGKSVCLNALILSILMSRKPDDVKMLMIDPKMVELSPYRRVPHLMHPVITDMKKAEAVLAWAVDKMEERYDLLARCRVRHLDSYNALGKPEVLDRLRIDPDEPEADAIPEKMPYIVIIADEMADMMMTSGKDVEGHIIRLAQKSRAVGIHLVLATQKPTVDVITGLIKSNLPARVSFQVASRTDSRVVLDEMGAERLLGNGDMLYLAPGTSNVIRAQGTYVSDDEINGVIDYFGDCEPEYSVELSKISSSGGGSEGAMEAPRNRDEYYDQAIDVVIREGRGSVSLLQRCLGIGYGRAARLIDYMAEDGIVGDYNGSQAREVLYTTEQWEALQNEQ